MTLGDPVRWVPPAAPASPPCKKANAAMSPSPSRRPRRRSLTAAGIHAALLVALTAPVLGPATGPAALVTPARADGPGRGLTARFEVEYLKFTIDHHFAALRMTELAAGTDRERDADNPPDEGTAPTPGFAPTRAKATIDQIKSLARRNNRTQREEILMSQRLLREWYGVEYQPRLSPVNRARIELLEEARAGDDFNVKFLEVFSRHHFIIAVRSVEAVTSRDLEHQELERMARNVIEVQMNDINEMRTLLSRRYGISDYQPHRGLKGEHSGDRFPDNTPGRFRQLTSDEDEDGEDHYDDDRRR